jgi:2',3'-cyclic-nucleotide 2'-phosphodiesterase
MKILYVGDVMAAPGRKVLAKVLPGLKKDLKPALVIVQAENSDDEGKGPGKKEIAEMQRAGADFFTGGNHSLRGKGSSELYKDESVPIIRPANMENVPGHSWQIIETDKGRVLVASILGQTVGRQITDVSNPLDGIDKILQETSDEKLVARIVNFHGDFSSEKRVFGYYLDGRVSAVVGDHWHVPTADAMVLPAGTAYITDVGMCGTLHSSLGVKTEIIAQRWKTGQPSRNVIEDSGPLQFNALLITIDSQTGLATEVEQIQRIV